MTQPQSTPDAADWLAFVRAGADEHKPTYAQLRAEGLTEDAIQTLFIARDGLAAGSSAEQVADFLRLSQRDYPVTEQDVRPLGKPARWMTPEELAAHQASEATAIVADLARQDRHYRTHPRTEATS